MQADFSLTRWQFLSDVVFKKFQQLQVMQILPRD
jgi:hypothetical protein